VHNAAQADETDLTVAEEPDVKEWLEAYPPYEPQNRTVDRDDVKR
jgi:hypothetical protein